MWRPLSLHTHLRSRQRTFTTATEHRLCVAASLQYRSGGSLREPTFIHLFVCCRVSFQSSKCNKIFFVKSHRDAPFDARVRLLRKLKTTRELAMLLLAPWLILPVVICLSQRLSHACLSASRIKAIPRMAQYISFGSLDLTQLLG